MRPLVVLLLFTLPAVAAPVPKALKKPSTEDGVWHCVEFNGNNGKVQLNVRTYWKIDGDRMSNGKSTAAEAAAADCPLTFIRIDRERPQLRDLKLVDGGRNSCVMEVDGDTLRWAWSTEAGKTITECKPADGVYYYVFERVKDAK